MRRYPCTVGIDDDTAGNDGSNVFAGSDGMNVGGIRNSFELWLQELPD
jgi:hypothetical protein